MVAATRGPERLRAQGAAQSLRRRRRRGQAKPSERRISLALGCSLVLHAVALLAVLRLAIAPAARVSLEIFSEAPAISPGPSLDPAFAEVRLPETEPPSPVTSPAERAQAPAAERAQPARRPRPAAPAREGAELPPRVDRRPELDATSALPSLAATTPRTEAPLSLFVEGDRETPVGGVAGRAGRGELEHVVETVRRTEPTERAPGATRTTPSGEPTVPAPARERLSAEAITLLPGSERLSALTSESTVTPPAPEPAPALTPVAVAAPAVPASPAGLGLGRLKVRLDGPRARVTPRATETISGKISGGDARRLVLSVNGAATDVVAAGRAFEVAVSLQRGVNHVRVVATDPRGFETEDVVDVEYVPAVESRSIAITSPPDGLTLSGDDPPLVVVEGEVTAPGVSTVWVVANERRIAVRAEEGRFRQVVPVLEPILSVWAETSPNGAPGVRSRALTVRAPGPASAVGFLVMDWPETMPALDAEITATWRSSPERLDGPVQRIPLTAFASSPSRGPADVFYVRDLQPGVYTFSLRYRNAGAGAVRSTLYLPGQGVVEGRRLKPVPLDGAGSAVIARLLLPLGVLWEQDDWFTGRSDSGDTITKFRFPEAVTWTERRSEP